MRDLSYDSDSPNAILGVFKVLGSDEDPIYHLYGIPIYLDRLVTTVDYQLAASLAWEDEPGRRLLHHLPSWTWAAWSSGSSKRNSSSSKGRKSRHPWMTQKEFWDTHRIWSRLLMVRRPGGYPYPSFYFLDQVDFLEEEWSERISLSEYDGRDFLALGIASSLHPLCIQSYAITVPVIFLESTETSSHVKMETFDGLAAEYNLGLDEPIPLDNWAAAELDLSCGEGKEVEAVALSRYREDGSWIFRGPQSHSMHLEAMLIKYIAKSTVRRVALVRLIIPLDSVFGEKLEQKRVDLILV